MRAARSVDNHPRDKRNDRAAKATPGRECVSTRWPGIGARRRQCQLRPRNTSAIDHARRIVQKGGRAFRGDWIRAAPDYAAIVLRPWQLRSYLRDERRP